MSKYEKIDVIGAAPYAVCLTDGREISPGQLLETELDEVTRNQIATGVLNFVERPEPIKATSRRAQASTTSTDEGESE